MQERITIAIDVDVEYHPAVAETREEEGIAEYCTGVSLSGLPNSGLAKLDDWLDTDEGSGYLLNQIECFIDRPQ